MKLQREEDFEGTLPDNRQAFTIAPTAELLAVLSDGIYKDKIGAVIRELSCNASDSHVAAGNTDQFIVQVPTRLEPTFAVEDFGTGIDPAQIASIFWTYGKSSKTNDNSQIGALGLGSKSPFAYTKTSFLVKNRYNGNEHTYMCFIDEAGFPAGAELDVKPTTEHNGVRVEIAVRSDDVYPFQDRIEKFFSYWDVKPKFVNKEFQFPAKTYVMSGDDWKLKDCTTYNHVSVATAIMGNVPYKLDHQAIPNISPQLKFILTRSFELTFPLGALSFQASREELSYNPATINVLETKAKAIVASFGQLIKAKVEQDATTPNILRHQYKQVVKTYMSLYGADPNRHDFCTRFGISQFTTTTGQAFNEERLNKDVSLKFDGLIPFNAFILSEQTERAKAVTVTHVQLDGLRLDKTTNTNEPFFVNVPWFSSTMVPDANKIYGSTPNYLSFTKPTLSYVKLNKHINQIIINDLSYRGFITAKTFFNSKACSSTCLVDPDKGVTKEVCKEQLLAALKFTHFEGVDIKYLSEVQGFALPKQPTYGTCVPTVRGQIEVRKLMLYACNTVFSSQGYERVDPLGFKAYYFLPTEKLSETADAIRGLRANGLLLTDTLFIVRSQEEITRLVARGAMLKKFSELVDETVLTCEAAFTAKCNLENFEHSTVILKLLNEVEDGWVLPANSQLNDLVTKLMAIKAIKRDEIARAKVTFFNLCSPSSKVAAIRQAAKPTYYSEKIIKLYPLLTMVFNGYYENKDKVILDDILLYVNAVDNANASAKDVTISQLKVA